MPVKHFPGKRNTSRSSKTLPRQEKHSPTPGDHFPVPQVTERHILCTLDDTLGTRLDIVCLRRKETLDKRRKEIQQQRRARGMDIVGSPRCAKRTSVVFFVATVQRNRKNRPPARATRNRESRERLRLEHFIVCVCPNELNSDARIECSLVQHFPPLRPASSTSLHTRTKSTKSSRRFLKR